MPVLNHGRVCSLPRQGCGYPRLVLWRSLGSAAVGSLLLKFKVSPAALFFLLRLRAQLDSVSGLICQIIGLEVFISAPSARILDCSLCAFSGKFSLRARIYCPL